ncbi:hypothetical protein KKI23_04215 [Patescibacteria group bacterium]|nr:hypothetical protein [Patescibacteria group bacterium]
MRLQTFVIILLVVCLAMIIAGTSDLTLANSSVPITLAWRSSWGPTWSPDGQRIAFTSDFSGDRDIWITPAIPGNKSWVKVTNSSEDETRPAWSPGGELLVYVKETDSESSIWICLAQEGAGYYSVCLLPADSTFCYTEPAFDSGGQGIFCVAVGRYEPIYQIVRVGFDGQVEIIFKAEWSIISQPRLADKAIYFTYNEVFACPPKPEIWRLDRQSGERQPVLADSVIGYSAGTLSPDGRHLAYVTDEFSTKKIQIRDLVENRLVVTIPSVGMALGPTWSPDGRFIAFSSQIYTGGDIVLPNGEKWGRNLNDIFIYPLADLD